MQRHDQITFLRNRFRAGEVREFRALVEDYFARLAPDPDGVALDWDGAQAVRAQINRRLPRILQVVQAAGLEGRRDPLATDPRPALGNPDVLQRIFSPRFADGGEQELYDVLDMALGVYEGDRLIALGRTFNPFFYAAMLLGWVGRAPRRLLRAVGIGASPSRRAMGAELARLEAVAARLADVEEAIERRFEVLQDQHAARLAEQARRVAELEERLDFAERLLARGPEAGGLPPGRRPQQTPV